MSCRIKSTIYLLTGLPSSAARFYRRECDGVGIYDFRLGVIRETIGNFRPI